MLNHSFEKVFFIILNLKLVQKVLVLLPKSSLLMMLFLILDIMDYVFHLRLSIRKSPKSILPLEFSSEPFLLINKFGRRGFYVSYQIR